MGEEPWEKQDEIALAVDQTHRVSVASCNGMGKSTLAAWLVCWFMATRKNAQVVTTAGNFKQVKSLWRKIRGTHNKCKRLPGVVLQTAWNLDAEWYAEGVSTDTEENFQGYHSVSGSEYGDDGGLLVIVDEASGVDDFIFNAIRGFTTSGNTYILLIGNPNKSEGEFYESHQKGRWTRFQVSAFDVPEHIIKPDWIEEQREVWDEDDPQWQVRVLGRFPTKGGDYQLFPMWLLEEAQVTAKDNPEVMGLHMGVDVSRGLSDKNVCLIMKHGRCFETAAWTSQDAMVTADKIVEFAREHKVPGENIHVDGDGLGGPIIDRLRQMGWGVDEVRGGMPPSHDWDWLIGTNANVLNRRAELHWAARRAMLGDMTCVPAKFAKTVRRQLSWSNYEFQKSSGKLKVEAKDDIKKRNHGVSPDYADAWVYAHSRTVSQPGILIF